MSSHHMMDEVSYDFSMLIQIYCDFVSEFGHKLDVEDEVPLQAITGMLSLHTILLLQKPVSVLY